MLAAVGVVISLLYTGSALATTAIGSLIPILRDSGELRTRFATYLLAAGAVGEFGPILLVTLVLSTTHPVHEATILVAFVALAVVLGFLSVRVAMARAAGARADTRIEQPTRCPDHCAPDLRLAALASGLGLDLLLGGFVAGMITRAALRGREVQALESKLTAVAFGFLVPFFFVTSGIDLRSRRPPRKCEALLKVALFLALFLVVRGAPAMLLYRGVLDARERTALAFFSASAVATRGCDHHGGAGRGTHEARPPPRRWWGRRCCRR